MTEAFLQLFSSTECGHLFVLFIVVDFWDFVILREERVMHSRHPIDSGKGILLKKSARGTGISQSERGILWADC